MYHLYNVVQVVLHVIVYLLQLGHAHAVKSSWIWTLSEDLFSQTTSSKFKNKRKTEC